jgi:hypothetical protein
MGSLARGLENAVDGEEEGAEGPERYPVEVADTVLDFEGEECSERRELKSEMGALSFPSIGPHSLSEPGGGDTGCLRNSHIVAILWALSHAKVVEWRMEDEKIESGGEGDKGGGGDACGGLDIYADEGGSGDDDYYYC